MSTQAAVLHSQQIHFDSWQFDGRRARAVSAESGLSFQDYGRMHVQRRSQAVKRRKGIPVWALNDESLREVICRYLEHRYYLPSAPHKSYEERLAICKAEAAKRIPEYRALLDDLLDRQDSLRSVEIQNVDSKIVLERRGFPAIVCAAVYQSYRLGWNSVQVANETGMKPPHVRILLYRLGHVWDEIQSGRSWRSRRSRNKIWTVEMLEKLWFLRKSRTWKQCGKAFGLCGPSVRAIYIHYFGMSDRVTKRRGVQS